MLSKLILSSKNNLSRKFACLFALLALLINTSTAQTNVSGGIYSNTTWTAAGNPYIITGDVVIFSGDTLTIQPGVIVKFDNGFNIDVRGSLYANGTSNDSIIFTSNNASPYAGIYSGISGGSYYRYCRFSYGDTALSYISINTISHCSFNSDYTGVLWGSNSFDSCVFIHDSIGIFCPNGGGNIVECFFLQNSSGINGNGGMFDSIINSTFLNNNIAVTGIVAGTIINSIVDSNKYYGLAGLSDIIGCSIKYNGVGTGGDETKIISNIISNNNIGINSLRSTIELNTISDNAIGIQTDEDKISCNTICNNTQYNIESEWSGNELANNNYWCLTDSAQIQATIYDAYQDINDGFVLFTPFDTVPCTSIPSGINELFTIPEAIKLFPNPNNGSFTVALGHPELVLELQTICIYNTLGQMIYKSTIPQSTTQISLNNTSTGVYLYRIISENGNLIGMGKFVLE